MIEGLSHITFIVRDLDRMENILLRIFDAEKIYDSGAKQFSAARERFFTIGQKSAPIWIAIMEGKARTTQSYDHIAFKIAESDYDLYAQRLRDLGLQLKEGRPRVEGEGRSIYFYDDDDHLFELHTGTLGERLARYASER